MIFATQQLKTSAVKSPAQMDFNTSPKSFCSSVRQLTKLYIPCFRIKHQVMSEVVNPGSGLWVGPSLCTYAVCGCSFQLPFSADYPLQNWTLSPPEAAPTENRASRRPRRVPMLHSESKKPQRERMAVLRFDQLTVKTPSGL